MTWRGGRDGTPPNGGVSRAAGKRREQEGWRHTTPHKNRAQVGAAPAASAVCVVRRPLGLRDEERQIFLFHRLPLVDNDILISINIKYLRFTCSFDNVGHNPNRISV
jgi:hypothetical protein